MSDVMVTVGGAVVGGRVGIHDIRGVGSALGASVGGTVSVSAEVEMGLRAGLAVVPVAGSTTTEVLASVGAGGAVTVGDSDVVSVSSTVAPVGTDVAIPTWGGAAVGASMTGSVVAVTAAVVGSRVRVVAPSVVGDAVTFSAPLLLAVGPVVTGLSPGQRTGSKRCVSDHFRLARVDRLRQARVPVDNPHTYLHPTHVV